MRKKLVSVLCAILLVFTAAGGLVGCGGGSGGGRSKQVLFVSDGGLTETTVMTKLKDEYNRVQGPIDGVRLEFQQKGSDDNYRTYVTTTARDRNAPDIYLVNDRFFKSWAGYEGILANLTELSAKYEIDLGLDGLYSQGMERYHYNTENNTSNPDDPIYGVLRDVTPTIMYYNKTAFEALHIICISAYEDEITQEFVDAFNTEHDLIGDARVTVTDLKRGFYRGAAKQSGFYTTNATWIKPAQNEVMVFNNKIAMSWDEQEDLNRIMSKGHNTDNAYLRTEYGQYQWWWFNYGFSVGGDCIEDVTGDGDWVFTVGDKVPNFIVADGYAGVQVGENTYDAGETIEYRDRVALDSTLVSSLLANGSTLNESNLTQEVLTLESEGKLIRLPSQREAFVRWVMLAQKSNYTDADYGYGGLEVSPIPSESTITGQAGMFTSQKVAILVDKSETFLTIDNAVKRMTGSDKFEWNIAPLSVYKKYNADGTVAVRGKPAGASDSNALSINKYSTKQREAMLVLKWLASEAAQNIIAEASFTLPNNPNSAVKYVATRSDKNLSIIADAAIYQTPGDWWYMPDRNWIEETWAAALNNEVRNQKMTLDSFFRDYIPTGNTALQRYKK